MIKNAFVLLTVVLLACVNFPTGTGHEESDAVPNAEFQVSVEFRHWGASVPQGSYLYTWNVGDASRVTIARLTDPADFVWEIVGSSGHGIRSGVWHGEVPDGSVATVATEPLLLPGEEATYRVSVTLRRDGQTRSADFTAALADQLPPP